MFIYTSVYLLVVPSLVLLDYRLQLPHIVSRVLIADAIHFTLKHWAVHHWDLCMQPYLGCSSCQYLLSIGRSQSQSHILHKWPRDPCLSQADTQLSITERYYWWLILCKETAKYIQGCAECQCHKVNNHPIRALLSPIYPTPEAMPFETIALDFITKLSESQGYDSILTVTNHNCTKMAVFIPCPEEINAEEMAALYTKHMFPSYGFPTKLISHWDPCFASKFTWELCKILGITQNISMAYHLLQLYPGTCQNGTWTTMWSAWSIVHTLLVS